MNILILGGYGQSGKPLTKHLLAQTKHRLIVAGRHGEKARVFADSLADSRVIPMEVDARDGASLKRALCDINLLLVACPTTDHAELVVDAALETRIDYLDIQLSERKLEVLHSREQEMLAKGLCFITEAGYHPGLPSALVRYEAARMDRLESAVVSCFMNLRGDLPYTEAVDELMEIFTHYQTQVFKEGVWTNPGSYALRKVDFGAGIGRRSCYSWLLEELKRLPEMLPSLRETGLYLASTGWLLDALTMVLLLGLKVMPRQGRGPLGRMLWWAMTSVSPPPYGVVLQVEGQGEKDGAQVRHLLRLAHLDGYEFTAIPVVALLMQYDEVRKPGLHLMGHLCEPVRLVADMQAMGIERTEIVPR
jgi:saccharopine dehydrogenase-like NADP-dependent oxidoreductase